MSKRIGFFIFDGLTALDLVGPFDTFAVATELASSRENGRAYDLVTVGLKKKAVVAESGMRFHPDTTILKAPALDTLVITASLKHPPAGIDLYRYIWSR